MSKVYKPFLLADKVIGFEAQKAWDSLKEQQNIAINANSRYFDSVFPRQEILESLKINTYVSPWTSANQIGEQFRKLNELLISNNLFSKSYESALGQCYKSFVDEQLKILDHLPDLTISKRVISDSLQKAQEQVNELDSTTDENVSFIFEETKDSLLNSENFEHGKAELKLFLSKLYSYAVSFQKSHPILCVILLFFFSEIYSSVKSVYLNIISPHIAQNLQIETNVNNNSVRKQVEQQFTCALEREALSHCRFVIVKVLNIRDNAGIKSAIIDTVYRGKIVKMLIKERSWSFVEYFDDKENKLKQGWVFTKHLGHFNY